MCNSCNTPRCNCSSINIAKIKGDVGDIGGKGDKGLKGDSASEAFMLYQSSIRTRGQISFVNQNNNSWL
jgi:hypothetical protein|tara:strand:- start:407 stop:613 length:207 start_codon:yes stop_codon:yes gene_type:complete